MSHHIFMEGRQPPRRAEYGSRLTWDVTGLSLSIRKSEKASTGSSFSISFKQKEEMELNLELIYHSQCQFASMHFQLGVQARE